MMYIDTNILIYLLEQHAYYSDLVAKTLDEATKGDGTLVTSAITVTEFLAGTKSSSLDTLRQVPRLSFISLEENLAEQAALLQTKNNLQVGDAIHLATALQQHAETFFTNDKQLAKIVKNYMAVREL